MILSFRKLVQPEDINPGNRLFGGRLMQWCDEAAAIYAMCQMHTKQIVTLKVSEILFKNPALSGDVLEFWMSNKKVGNTSLTVACTVIRKSIEEIPDSAVSTPADVIMDCELTFVAIDKEGKPKKHGMPV